MASIGSCCAPRRASGRARRVEARNLGPDPGARSFARGTAHGEGAMKSRARASCGANTLDHKPARGHVLELDALPAWVVVAGLGPVSGGVGGREGPDQAERVIAHDDEVGHAASILTPPPQPRGPW